MSRFETLLCEVDSIKTERERYSESLRKKRLLEMYGESYYKNLKKQAEHDALKQSESEFVYQKSDKRKQNGNHLNQKPSIYFQYSDLISQLYNRDVGPGIIANHLKQMGVNATKQGVYYFIKRYLNHVSD